MNESPITEETPLTSTENTVSTSPIDYHVEKIASISHLGAMDQIAMEIVDTMSNEHYMILVSADATLQTIEPQLRVFLLIV